MKLHQNRYCTGSSPALSPNEPGTSVVHTEQGGNCLQEMLSSDQLTMTVHDALGEYFERRGVKPTGESVDEWLRENWVYMSVRGYRIPVKPLYGYKKVVVLHDVHHLVTGYDTSWTGEFEVAAWELGSGGCGSFLLMWNNRILTVLLGLLFAPRRTWRAFRRGIGQRNVYRLDCRTVLARELDDLRAYASGREARTPGAGALA